jgi:hypothetical protein
VFVNADNDLFFHIKGGLCIVLEIVYFVELSLQSSEAPGKLVPGGSLGSQTLAPKRNT